MSDKVNDGGPAFPQIETEPMDVVTRAGEYTTIGRVNASGGMTLRDYFAAKAMAGDWASQDAQIGQWNSDCPTEILDARALLYYRMADAMLRARGAQ